MQRLIAVASWGAHAQRFVAHHRTARVAALLASGTYLEAAGDFLCLGDAGIGDGPLNALLAPGVWRDLAGLLPVVGEDVSLLRGTIALGRVCVATQGARAWSPAPAPARIAPDRLAAGVAGVQRRARLHPRARGLAPRILGVPGAGGRAGAAIAARVGTLRCWLAQR